ncbi:MAG: putative glycoside hydrolase [Chloroflexota bacterium]
MSLPRFLRRSFALLALLALVASACSDGQLPLLPSPTPVPPRDVTVSVRDRGAGDPLDGVELIAGDAAVTTDADGTAIISALRGGTVSASLDGWDAGTGIVPDEGDLVIELRSNVVAGVVTDIDGAPLAGATVFVDGARDQLIRSDRDGAYRLVGVAEGATLVVKRAGYRLAEMPISDGSQAADVALEPFEARALYAPASIFERPGALDEMLALIDETEANAMVIDVKETDGQLFWATQLPEAIDAGATQAAPILDLEELLPQLKARGVYTIARMVSMKDNTVGVARPELAVMNVATGEPWRDNIGGIWLDPAAAGVAEYLAALAGDLADKGFDEVQLDYIRYFSDGPYEVADTNLPNTQSFRLPAMRRVLRVVSDRLAATRTFLGADVFPISFIVPDDQGIGQRPETIMPYVDTFSPMVYPSHYGPGVFGFDVPNDHPYDVVAESITRMSTEAEGLPLVIRPWIQDFGYGSFAPYSAEQVAAEMTAAADTGAQGWMIWNPGASFSRGALGAPRPDEAAGVMALSAPGAPAASPAG